MTASEFSSRKLLATILVALLLAAGFASTTPAQANPTTGVWNSANVSLGQTNTLSPTPSSDAWVAVFLNGQFSSTFQWGTTANSFSWEAFGKCANVFVEFQWYASEPVSPVYFSGMLAVTGARWIGHPSACAPGTPGTPTAVAGDGSATISVVAPSSGGTVASYTVTASPNGATCTVTPSATSCVISGLTNGTAYTFASTATNAAGTSAASASSSPVTPSAPPSPRPPNGSGSNSPAPTPVPEITPPSRGVIRAVFPGFAANSTKLTQDMRKEVRSFLKANPGLNQVTCRGFTSAPATPQDRVLARERGKVTCDFIKKLRPEADITIRSGSHTDKPGVQVRRVQIILR